MPEAPAGAPGGAYEAVVLVLVLVLVEVDVLVVVEVVVVVDVDVELVVDVLVVVVVVHGTVTVVVGPGAVTVTVEVTTRHAPSLSPWRRWPLSAFGLTLIVTNGFFFDFVRWQMVTLPALFPAFGGFFFATPAGPAIATDVASPATNSATRSAFSFIQTP